MAVQLIYKSPEVLMLRMVSYGAWVLGPIAILVGFAIMVLLSSSQELHCRRGEAKEKLVCRFESTGFRASHVYDFTATDSDGLATLGQASIKGGNTTTWLAYKDAGGGWVRMEGSGENTAIFLNEFAEFWNDKSRLETTIANDDRLKVYLSGGIFVFFGLLCMYFSLPVTCTFDKRNGVALLKNGFSVISTIQLLDIADFKMEDSALYQTAIILRSGVSIALPRGREIPLSRRREIGEVVRHFLRLPPAR